MKKFNDDDIEVLGADIKAGSHKPHKKAIILIAILIVALLSIIGWLIGIAFEHYKQEPLVLDAVVETVIPAEPQEIDPTEEATDTVTQPAAAKLTALSLTHDSINDVSFRIFNLSGTRASVSFTWPDSLNHNDVLLATPAADVRRDNGDINCEFVIDNTQISRGRRKSGWCYIAPDGSISMGMGGTTAYEAKMKAINEGGCFFRQYALVMDGDTCPNKLRGKAKRRALGFLNGEAVLVTSDNRESIYDFSQALADYGFSHALYLPGGDGMWMCRTTDGDETPNFVITRNNENFLIFSAR